MKSLARIRPCHYCCIPYDCAIDASFLGSRCCTSISCQRGRLWKNTSVCRWWQASFAHHLCRYVQGFFFMAEWNYNKKINILCHWLILPLNHAREPLSSPNLTSTMLIIPYTLWREIGGKQPPILCQVISNTWSCILDSLMHLLYFRL